MILTVSGLRKCFGGQVVLDGVDADLHEGEVVLLRGDNGSGKTTLLNILTGNMEPDSGTIHLWTNGEEETFRFPRQWWKGLNPFDHFTPERVAIEGVGRTWQDVRLFPTLTLLDNIAVAQRAQPGENPLRSIVSGSRLKSESANRQTSVDLLADLKMNGREQSSGDRISLGQSKRVAIARAVRAGARILFLDEPLSGLDADGIEEVLGLLSSLARNERLTLVIVEHTFNIPRVLSFAHTVWTLREGRIAVQSRAEADAEYCAEVGDGAVALVARQLGTGYHREDVALYRGASITCFSPNQANADRPVLLDVRSLVVYRGSRLVVGCENATGQVEGLSFCLRQGDIAILRAPNGWGKTTLLEAIAGRIANTSGTILLGERAINALPVWARFHCGVSFLTTDTDVFPNLSVEEALLLSGAGERLDRFPVLHRRRMSSLSGGEQQLVRHATTGKSRVGVYDEPYANLDADRIFGVTGSLISPAKHDVVLILSPSTIPTKLSP